MSDEQPRRRFGRPWEGEVSSVEKVWVEGEDEPEEGRLPFESDEVPRDESGLEIPAPGQALTGPIGPPPAEPRDERAQPFATSPDEPDEPDEPVSSSLDEATDPGRTTADEPATDAEPTPPDDDTFLPPVPDSGLYVEDLTSGPTSLDDITEEDYLAASTREFQNFAEELERAATEEVERQAVAASIPGVGSGLIGFEDVTGQPTVTEEDVEVAEQQAASDLTVRIGTGLVLVGIFLGGLMLGRGWFAGVVTLVMLISLGEFYATVRTRGYVPVALFGFIGVIAAAIGTLRGSVEAIGVAVALTLALTGLMYGITVRRNPLENAAITMVGMVWVSMAAFIIGIAKAEDYVGLVLLVVLLTALYDIGAYFVGRTVGRRQLAPQVSPGKTVEGFLGGFATVLVIAAILSTFPALFQVDLFQALALAVVVALMGPLGDAAESVIKRGLDVKDMGSLLPGHGGMLDRIDALLFVIPPAYLLFDIFGLLGAG